MTGLRVVENLNQALHGVLAADPTVYLLGEDVADPYGGAFKATRGLSTRYPGRVLSTPISEQTIAGIAAGLALAGSKAVAEIMFADFVGLAFDQIVNFASKSTMMYGRPVAVPLVVRCPSGGNRGYGPTHSQSPQKHFIGVPGLSLYELTPFHDSAAVLAHLLSTGRPSLLFEDKVLYTRRMFADGSVDDLLRYDLPTDLAPARVSVRGVDSCDVVVIAPGGLTHRVVAAMRAALVRADVVSQLFVPVRLYPFDIEPMLPAIEQAGAVVVVEESTAGGTWGAEVAHTVHGRAWRALRGPVRLVHSADSVIPAAVHLEREVLVQEKDICRVLVEAGHD